MMWRKEKLKTHYCTVLQRDGDAFVQKECGTLARPDYITDQHLKQSFGVFFSFSFKIFF